MNYMFLGLLYDKSIENALMAESKVGLQSAANQYQWGLINGLAAVLQEPISVISSYPTGSYPRSNRRLFYSAVHTNPSELVDIAYIPHVNYQGIRELCRAREFYRAVARAVENGAPTTIFVYSLQIAFTNVMRRLKMRYPNSVRIVLVVPDLPGRLGLQRSITAPAGLWDRVTGPSRLHGIQFADAYILLTNQMQEALDIKDKPRCVVEGFAPESGAIAHPVTSSPRRVITYTGALSIDFGLTELFQAFHLLPTETYELRIAGSGPGTSYVEHQARQTSNIKYLGHLDKLAVERLQRESTILINPRKPKGRYTNYSFPSKTLVYLAAGRPVIAYRLPGIPDDYDPYLAYVDGDTPQALAAKITEVCDMGEPELARRGMLGRNWAISEKGERRQGERIVAMLRDLNTSIRAEPQLPTNE